MSLADDNFAVKNFLASRFTLVPILPRISQRLALHPVSKSIQQIISFSGWV
jgi:hypothetical protein